MILNDAFLSPSIISTPPEITACAALVAGMKIITATADRNVYLRKDIDFIRLQEWRRLGIDGPSLFQAMEWILTDIEKESLVGNDYTFTRT